MGWRCDGGAHLHRLLVRGHPRLALGLEVGEHLHQLRVHALDALREQRQLADVGVVQLVDVRLREE